MAKIVKTAAVKGRETKLNKKSSEDLIQIILRKDKTERNLNAQIVNLKAEVNSLNSRIKGYDKDMEGTEETLGVYKDKIKTLNEQLDENRADISEIKQLNKNLSLDNVKMKDVINIYRVALAIVAIVAIVSIVVLS